MNHKARRAVSKSLRAIRKQLGLSRDELAMKLGWPVQFYCDVEDGAASISEGQQNDVRRLMAAERAKAAVRDQIRAPLRPYGRGKHENITRRNNPWLR